MAYYRAREQNTVPFLVFDFIAETDEDLQVYLDENNSGNPDVLVIEISDVVNELPSYTFGICHKKIFNNALVDRDQLDIDAQEELFVADIEITKNIEVSDTIEVSTFLFDGKEFPLGASFRLIYEAIFNTSAANHLITTTTGGYTLQSADITTFKSAYYAKNLTFKTEFAV